MDREDALAAVDAVELRVQQVHLRGADERRDEHIGRLGEHFMRRGDLLDDAVAHDRDAVGHRQRLELVMCDNHRSL